MTITYQTIINEINRIPVNFLPDVYNIVHSFTSKIETKEQNRKNILQFAGSWSDMPDEKFNDMMDEIHRNRKEMFSKDVQL
ncbi:MAG: hypothetical protein K9H64_19970 [Bacteroidales bacterium]|nr:hypothetical protein [Bacteroidales bacterium]MCF8458346.1 hypothetical protein [Bacteroidales bacterium]